MQNTRTGKIRTTLINTDAELYVHDLSLYRDVPQTEIKLFEFEELAVDRLQLFRIMEQASSKGHELFSCDWIECIKDDLLKSNMRGCVRLISDGEKAPMETELENIQARRADHLSHHILRLMFCRNQDLRRWFMAREMDWFRIKFTARSTTAILKFFEINDFNYIPISDTDKQKIHKNLVECTPDATDESVKATDFYRVLFTHVLPLVKCREMFLNEGYAYVPFESLLFCIQYKFQNELEEGLNHIKNKLPKINDDRLKDVLHNLLGAYNESQLFNIRGNKDPIDPNNLDDMSRAHYPLCMRQLHEELRASHHLKHYGRLIYGLFLKAIGLQYDDCIKFWRKEFMHIMNNNTFNKKYLYHINYQFGKVGHMGDYAPFSCLAIIMGNPGTGEIHGCPFKHFAPSVLTTKLKTYGVTNQCIDDIMDLVKNGQYQAACTRYYEFTHLQPPANTINHPNQYFEESRNLHSDESDSESED